MEIEAGDRYEATVRLRRGDGWRVKPEAEAMDGKRYVLEALWEMGDEDTSIYRGEWAMGPPTRKPAPPDWPENLLWVASGDLVDIEPLTASPS